MSNHPRPPRLATWLAAVSSPRDDRGLVMGDLEERFAARVRSRGVARARVWYWRQVMGLVLLLAPRRAVRAISPVIFPGTTRSALRSLLRSPVVSLVAMATLAVGIAAPSAMLGLAAGTTNALPEDNGDRILRMSIVDRRGRVHFGIVQPLLEAWRDGGVGPGHALDALAAYQSRTSAQVAVGGGDDTPAGRYWGVYATAGLFRMLNVSPVAGRLYTDSDNVGPPAVLLREDIWEERFDRDPDAIGQVLRVAGRDHVIVGVLPREFGFPIDHRLWMSPAGGEDPMWSVVGRLAPGARPEVAREQLDAILKASPLGERSEGTLTVQVESFTTAHFGAEGDRAWSVGLISLILVLVAGVNVAHVILARAATRSRETAIRRALGASRTQVMAQTLTEVLFLALGGGVFGLLLGRAGLHAMVWHLESQVVIRPYWMDFTMGPRSILLAASLALLALAVAGVLPAVRSSKADLDQALRLRPHAGAGRSGRLMTAIVGVEVALSCFLLTVSAGVIQEAVATLRTGAEFPTNGVMTGHVLLDASQYAAPENREELLAEVRDALLADPSVQRAAFASHLPGKNGSIRPVGLAGVDPDATQAPPAQVRAVDDEFFPLLGITAAVGRLPTGLDGPTAVVNRAFVQARGIAGNAVGRRITVAQPRSEAVDTATIIGVVDDRGVTPHVRGLATPGVYLALESAPPVSAYVLLSTSPGTSVPDAWHRALAPLDPYLPLGDVLSLEETQRRGHGAATLFLNVFLGLGAATFLVALVGVHGVHSFLVSGRAREIGVRRALGALDRQVILETLRRGLRPVWGAILLGGVLGGLVVRSVVPIEPQMLTLILGPVVMLVTSVVAMWAPTSRAAWSDPMHALRED